MRRKPFTRYGLIPFDKAYRKARRLLSWYVRPFLGDRTLLSLHELTGIGPPLGESYTGTLDIRINKVIGSENRNRDYAEGFYPAHRWMENRWSTIWGLMENNELEEPITVYEYGGIYFVRDGHHRVSTGRMLGRVYIRAHVTKFTVPYTLSEGFSRGDLPNFCKMVEFERRTGFFTVVPGALFDIRRLKTWSLLEKEIRQWSPSWFQRHPESHNLVEEEGEQGDTGAHDRIWYNSTYKITLDYVQQKSLHYLFPGWGDTDVAMEIIRIWNTLPAPDELWIGEMYSLFIKRSRIRRFFLVPVQLFYELVKSLLRTPCDERCRFLRVSNIKAYRPEFRLPSDTGKKYWRKLFREVFKDHAQTMKKELGRPPLSPGINH